MPSVLGGHECVAANIRLMSRHILESDLVMRLKAKHVNARTHLRKIVALVEIHGKEAVSRAIDDGLELAAFSAEYIAHILSARRRIGEKPAALQLTRRADLLELELPEPDLSIYDRDDGDEHGQDR